MFICISRSIIVRVLSIIVQYLWLIGSLSHYMIAIVYLLSDLHCSNKAIPYIALDYNTLATVAQCSRLLSDTVV